MHYNYYNTVQVYLTYSFLPRKSDFQIARLSSMITFIIFHDYLYCKFIKICYYSKYCLLHKCVHHTFLSFEDPIQNNVLHIIVYMNNRPKSFVIILFYNYYTFTTMIIRTLLVSFTIIIIYYKCLIENEQKV